MQASLMNWTLDALDSGTSGFMPPLDMRESIANIRALPPLPGTAARIIDLISDPEADVDKLTEIIEMDPMLAAQVVRWASSALYGYRGKVDSVRNAIIRVLGFNFVFDLALGLAVLAPLKAPQEGVIGTRAFWMHALTSTRLMKLLIERMPVELQPNRDEVFIAGLIHNIGFPLFGHQFPEEFAHLQSLIAINPSANIYNLETFAFGVNHAQLGAWLMNTWGMPRVLTDIVYHHHNPYYRGDNYRLNLLTYLNDFLLGQLGIGDAAQQPFADELWGELGLQATLGQQALAQIQAEIGLLKEMAESMTNVAK